MTKSKEEMLSLQELNHVIKRLRAPDGCPWDQAQNMQDLKQYILEECYEVMDAIDKPPPNKLHEELGDLLFHIVFIAQIAEEQGDFKLHDVLETVYDKMIRRHPHVFGNTSVKNVEAVKKNWWKIKQQEGATPSSNLESIPRHLPALQRAYRLSQRASQVGLDWDGPQAVLKKVKEELVELEQALENQSAPEIREELGDLLFAFVNLARHLKNNPEELLQESNQKFLDRFKRLEQYAHKKGRTLGSLTPQEMDQWWETIKTKKSGHPGSPP